MIWVGIAALIRLHGDALDSIALGARAGFGSCLALNLLALGTSHVGLFVEGRDLSKSELSFLELLVQLSGLEVAFVLHQLASRHRSMSLVD